MIENHYIKMDSIQLTLFMIYIKVIYDNIVWYLNELDNYAQKLGYIFFLSSTLDCGLNIERDFCPKTSIPLTRIGENEEYIDGNNEKEEKEEDENFNFFLPSLIFEINEEENSEMDEWQENTKEIEEEEEEEEETEPDSIILEEKNIATVVKGGKIRRKRLICVTTDLENSLGLGIAKDDNSLSAFYKSKYASFNNLIQIPITHNGSIPHLVNSKFAAANLVIIPAISGTGIIAPYFLKSLLYICGISNMITKQFGSSSILNNSIALVKALKILNRLIWHSKMRSKKLFKFYKKILK